MLAEYTLVLTSSAPTTTLANSYLLTGSTYGALPSGGDPGSFAYFTGAVNEEAAPPPSGGGNSCFSTGTNPLC